VRNREGGFQKKGTCAKMFLRSEKALDLQLTPDFLSCKINNLLPKEKTS
jgi:hypothetical protein